MILPSARPMEKIGAGRLILLKEGKLALVTDLNLDKDARVIGFFIAPVIEMKTLSKPLLSNDEYINFRLKDNKHGGLNEKVRYKASTQIESVTPQQCMRDDENHYIFSYGRIDRNPTLQDIEDAVARNGAKLLKAAVQGQEGNIRRPKKQLDIALIDAEQEGYISAEFRSVAMGGLKPGQNPLRLRAFFEMALDSKGELPSVLQNGIENSTLPLTTRLLDAGLLNEEDMIARLRKLGYTTLGDAVRAARQKSLPQSFPRYYKDDLLNTPIRQMKRELHDIQAKNGAWDKLKGADKELKARGIIVRYLPESAPGK